MKYEKKTIILNKIIITITNVFSIVFFYIIYYEEYMSLIILINFVSVLFYITHPNNKFKFIFRSILNSGFESFI